jgi:hypothetical protein
VLAGCGREDVGAALDAPAEVDPIEGTELSRITLSERAAERLGIETAAVAEVRTFGGSQATVPYGALLYDPTGATWIYVNPTPLVFVREAVVVERIEDGTAYLTDGPDVGTQVAIVGVAELWGAETGVGGEH